MKNKKIYIVLFLLVCVFCFCGCDITEEASFYKFTVNGSTISKKEGQYVITSNLNKIRAYVKITDKVGSYKLTQTEYVGGNRENGIETYYACYAPNGNTPHEDLKEINSGKDYKLTYMFYTGENCNGENLGYLSQWFYTYSGYNPSDKSPLSPATIKEELEAEGYTYYREVGGNLVDCRDDMADIEENKIACYAYTQVGKTHTNCCSFVKQMFELGGKTISTCYTDNFEGYSKTNNISHVGALRWSNDNITPPHMAIIYKAKNGVWKVIEANMGDENTSRRIIKLTTLADQIYYKAGRTTYYKPMM